MNTIKNLYQDAPTYSISNEFRKSQPYNHYDLIYGELAIHSFIYALELIGFTSNKRCVDLGCGDAKLILAGALYFGNSEMVGVEVVPTLAELAQTKLSALKKLNKDLPSDVKIIRGNFQNIELAYFDVIYINGAAFCDKTWQVFLTNLNDLPKEIFIISVARKIHKLSFIYSTHQLASWGDCVVYIYQS